MSVPPAAPGADLVTLLSGVPKEYEQAMALVIAFSTGNLIGAAFDAIELAPEIKAQVELILTSNDPVLRAATHVFASIGHLIKANAAASAALPVDPVTAALAQEARDANGPG